MNTHKPRPRPLTIPLPVIALRHADIWLADGTIAYYDSQGRFALRDYKWYTPYEGNSSIAVKRESRKCIQNEVTQ